MTKTQHYAMATELDVLTRAIHQKIPIITDGLHTITDIDTEAAQVLLNRIQELQTSYQEIDGRKQTICPPPRLKRVVR